MRLVAEAGANEVPVSQGNAIEYGAISADDDVCTYDYVVTVYDYQAGANFCSTGYIACKHNPNYVFNQQPQG
ncbi:hypothetical protein CATMQ487_13200 [Sphaerotilus microaerophilus]|uniref:Uncharacterized protein n=1 Tax=Sphaerotilus microaerophilus TaxID=2914710 RepID=A0ABN6PM88_9BURK|nr:hypothetical protein CATMQ487_13200 [Sphaerotilus sp. FB-5]